MKKKKPKKQPNTTKTCVAVHKNLSKNFDVAMTTTTTYYKNNALYQAHLQLFAENTYCTV